jgi:hypothetical protein
MFQKFNSNTEILMIHCETPYNRMEVISLFEDINAILEEVFVF